MVQLEMSFVRVVGGGRPELRARRLPLAKHTGPLRPRRLPPPNAAVRHDETRTATTQKHEKSERYIEKRTIAHKH